MLQNIKVAWAKKKKKTTISSPFFSLFIGMQSNSINQYSYIAIHKLSFVQLIDCVNWVPFIINFPSISSVYAYTIYTILNYVNVYLVTGINFYIFFILATKWSKPIEFIFITFTLARQDIVSIFFSCPLPHSYTPASTLILLYAMRLSSICSFACLPASFANQIKSRAR